MGRGQPHYMNANGVQQLRPHVKGGKRTDPPHADTDVIEQLSRVIKRRRKVGLTTNVNQTGATLTSVAVVILTTGVRTCSQTLCSREEVNCIQTVSVSDLIQQGGRAGRVSPGEHYVMGQRTSIIHWTDSVIERLGHRAFPSGPWPMPEGMELRTGHVHLDRYGRSPAPPASHRLVRGKRKSHSVTSHV